jgi:DNA-directed RNA polymerase subunit RPC12/RpoP
MVNWNSYWCYMIIFFLIILLSIGQYEEIKIIFLIIQCVFVLVQPSDATISCYECANCSEPFSVSSATNASGCNACYVRIYFIFNSYLFVFLFRN